jgi:hypothetical protein
MQMPRVAVFGVRSAAGDQNKRAPAFKLSFSGYSTSRWVGA